MNNKKAAIRADKSARKWNWGAFTFTLWWSIANRVWIGLLVLVPILNLVWPFIMAY